MKQRCQLVIFLPYCNKVECVVSRTTNIENKIDVCNDVYCVCKKFYKATCKKAIDNKK